MIADSPETRGAAKQTVIDVKQAHVLPPTEEDVRAFRQKRRRELTRRGFIVGGVALALGALTIPFWLRGGEPVSPESLLPRLREARADPGLLKQLCLTFYRDANPEIRRLATMYMQFLPGDEEVFAALWDRIRNDPVQLNRTTALDAQIAFTRKEDIAAFVALYRSAPWARQTIDEALKLLNWVDLRDAMK